MHRIKEGLRYWPTNILALVLIGICIGLVYADKATLTEVAVAIPAILYAFWHKGKKQDVNDGQA